MVLNIQPQQMQICELWVIREGEVSSRNITLDAPVSVVEGEMIAVTLTTSEAVPAGETIMVELNITENSGSFIDPNNLTTYHAMTSVRNMEPIMIPTRKQVATADGEIEIAIARGSGYEPGPTNDSTATIAIQEEDLLPKVTIALPMGAPIKVDEGEEIQFVVSASTVSPTPSDPVMVHVQLVDSGDFLGTGDNPRVISVASGSSQTFDVSTVADAMDEADGSITAMVVADPNQTDPDEKTTYLLGATEYISAVVMINDNDDATLPSVEISAASARVNEGEDVVFNLTASNVQGTPFEVHVSLSEVGGDFLVRDLSASFITMTNFDGSSQMLEIPITEATLFDNVAESNGNITARILSDPADTDTYAVGAMHTASITVTDSGANPNLPGISFGDISLGGTVTTSNYSIVEGGLIEITIDSTVMIAETSGLAVRYSVGGSGDFITLPSDNTIPNFSSYIAGTPGTGTLTIANNQDEYILRINTNNDSVEELDGSVSITLLPPERQASDPRPYYLVNPSDTSRVINITDNDPLLTISNVTEGKLTIAEGTDATNPTSLNVEVAIEGSVTPLEEITVSYSTELLTATSEEYSNAMADDFTDTSSTLTFPTSASDAKSFVVPIIADAVQESTEAFAINFAVTAGSARIQHTQVIVLITDDDEAATVPAISIEAPVSVVEGEMIAATLVTSETIGAGETISVELTITENTGTFLEPSFTTRSFDMTSVRDREPIMIPTRKRVATADGEIELAVVRGNNYEPDTTKGSTVTVAILEEDLLPKVTIALPSGAPTTVDEGEDIQFVLSASAVTPAPSDPVMVHVQLVDSGDFLGTGDNPRTLPVASGGTYTFDVSTVADIVDEANGSITAMVMADPNQIDPTKKTTYLLGAK